MVEKSTNNGFEKIFERIKAETEIKSIRQLAETIGKKHPTVLSAKTKNNFPASWAYEVGRKFGLLTEWIMTGEGPKRLEERITHRELTILDEFEEWSQEEILKNPERKVWLEIQLLDSFEKFRKWKIKRDEKKNRDLGQDIKNVA